MINRHQDVSLSRVRARKSPIIGAVVVADIVLKDRNGDPDGVKAEIMSLCRASLASHKVPAVISVVAAIEASAGGKLARQDA